MCPNQLVSLITGDEHKGGLGKEDAQVREIKGDYQFFHDTDSWFPWPDAN